MTKYDQREVLNLGSRMRCYIGLAHVYFGGDLGINSLEYEGLMVEIWIYACLVMTCYDMMLISYVDYHFTLMMLS